MDDLSPFDKLRLVLAIVISVVWVLSVALDAVPHNDYDPPTTVHVLMMAVVGALFATLKRGGGGE